jgi:uncharacterized protein (TIGR03067 family)
MLSLVGILTLIAPAPAEDSARAEHEKLNGNWRLISVEVEGKKMPSQQANEFSLTFKSGKFTSFRAGEKKTGSYTVDPTKKPKTMDIVPDEGADKGKTWSLIYTLDGNTLRIIGAEIGKDRPANFDTKDRAGIILMILRHE